MKNKVSYKKIIDLLIKGINNRTRQRDYFREYIETLNKNKCSSFEKLPKERQLAFSNMIAENEDKYVVPQNSGTISIEDIKYLVSLKNKIKDVNDFTDLCDLVGIDDKKQMAEITEKSRFFSN